MTGQWILVLGARSDIAMAVAHRYAATGYNIYLAARNHEELENDITDFKIRHSVEVRTLEFDALDYEGHESFYDGIPEKPLGVVCAVGYLGEQAVAEKDFNEARKIIDTNYTGCVSVLNVVANDFERRKKGFIIGISSAAGDRGRKSNYCYGSAKAAFSTYLSGLRNRLYSSGVRVLTVKPGFVLTRMTEGMKLSPLLMARPDEVARDIVRAQERHRDVLYTKWFWKWIMLVIKSLPEAIFKKTNL